MQEEVEQRTVTLIVNTAKLTEQELEKALSKLLAHMRAERQHKSVKEKHGKMTVKQLAEQNRGMKSIEVSDENIGSFNRVARKYGIDFAPFKVKGKERYLIFFKAADEDAMTAAFTEYTDKMVWVLDQDSEHHIPQQEAGEKTGCVILFLNSGLPYRQNTPHSP